jgi:hypothetical protein
MKFIFKISFPIFIILLAFSCKKNKEPFSKKLQINVIYWNVNGNHVEEKNATNVDAESGTNLTFYYSIGGEKGFGKYAVEEVVQSFHVTIENSRGTKTCIFVPDGKINGDYSVSIPVRESAKYTFKLTSKEGEEAIVGPIQVNAVVTNKVFNNIGGCTNSKMFAPNASLANPFVYSSMSYDQFYAGYPIFASKEIAGKTYLISPSKFAQYGILNEYTSVFDCWWGNTEFMHYNGSLNLDEFELSNNNHSYQDLESLNFSAPQDTLFVEIGKRFIFKTAEGKKGIAKFTQILNQTNAEVGFVFEFQK